MHTLRLNYADPGDAAFGTNARRRHQQPLGQPKSEYDAMGGSSLTQSSWLNKFCGAILDFEENQLEGVAHELSL